MIQPYKALPHMINPKTEPAIIRWVPGTITGFAAPQSGVSGHRRNASLGLRTRIKGPNAGHPET